jgi:hypothetical protein
MEHPALFMETVTRKASSWLQRFLLHGDVEEEGSDRDSIEVVLPIKGK